VHEISIVQSVLDAALEKAEGMGARHIHCLRLRIGALTGVVPDALQFAFETLREGTLASEAQLEIENVPVGYWCQRCQIEFAQVGLDSHCPQCGALATETRRGLELDLVSMEIS
jgi:hydrogenase nickel incorporation protein HypA/HybF